MNKAWEKRDALLKLDTRSAEFMDHKVILQKPEDKEETKYVCWKVPTGGKRY